MGWTWVALGAVVLAQIGGATVRPSAPGGPGDGSAGVAAPSNGTASLLPPRSGRAKTPPGEMIVEALRPRPGTGLTGRPLPLATALSGATEQRQQLDVTHAYWHLARTVAIYNDCLDYDKQLQQLAARPDAAAQLRPVRASAAAALRQAELDAVECSTSWQSRQSSRRARRCRCLPMFRTSAPIARASTRCTAPLPPRPERGSWISRSRITAR